MGRIEDAITELKSLATIKPLKGAQLSRFKELCIFLRKNNFTNSDIAALTDGAYSPITIKEYTRGVTSANTAKREELMGLLSKLVDQGENADDVRAFLNLQEQLARKGMSISSISDFVKLLQALEIDIDEIPAIREQLGALFRGGVSTQQIAALAQYAGELSKMGMQPFGLKGICDAAKKHGGSAEKLIEAIGAYENLLAIKNQITVENAKLQQVQQSVRQAENKLHEVEVKKSQTQKEINSVDKLHKMGFVDRDFVDMQKLCDTMGGPEQVLAALKEYSSADQLAAKNKELQEQRDELIRKNEKLKHENMHMLDTISVCRDLIFERDFGEQAIVDVYNLAQKYGNPITVRQALEKYGSIQGLDSKINEQMKQIVQNDAAIEEQERQEAELKGRASSLTHAIHQAHESTIQAIKKQASEGIDNLTSTLIKSIANVESVMQRYAEMEAKAETLKKELQFARILLAIELPGSIREMDPSMALLLLKALDRFCKEKGINTQVLPPKAVTLTQPNFQYAALSMDQIIAWAKASIDYYLQTNPTANNNNGGGLPA